MPARIKPSDVARPQGVVLLRRHSVDDSRQLSDRRTVVSCGSVGQRSARQLRRGLPVNALPKPPRGFRHVPGYSGWAVSRSGVVMSCKRFGHGHTWGAWHYLKLQKRRPTPKDAFYIYVGIRTSSTSTTRVRVHRLVLAAFVGPCPDGKEGCHNNGKSTDNRLTNLRWGTPVSNSADQRRHGTIRVGAKRPGSKLTDSVVMKIIESSSSVTVLADRYGVSESLVYKIRSRKKWKHVIRRSRR